MTNRAARGDAVATGSPSSGEGHKFVFVGGLHRSGTSLMADLLAAHPQASGLEGTSVPEDEGQHLQDVYRTARAHGGPGRFAFAADAHLTESDAPEPSDIRRRLLAAWEPYWDLSSPVLVEKSPPNMIRARYLRAVFPESSFVMMLRHPIAVAGATQKWSHTSYRSLVRHWLTAYETMFSDIGGLDRVTVVRYEDLIAAPGPVLSRVLQEVGLGADSSAAIADKVRVVSGINDRYFERWRRPWPWRALARRVVDSRYGARVRDLSYDVADPVPLPTTW